MDFTCPTFFRLTAIATGRRESENFREKLTVTVSLRVGNLASRQKLMS
jgi:hypothetical protein